MRPQKILHKLLNHKHSRTATIAAVIILSVAAIIFISMQNYSSNVGVDQAQQQEKPQEVGAVVSFVTGTLSASGDNKYLVTDEFGSRTEVIIDPELTMMTGASTAQAFIGRRVQVAVSKNQKTGVAEAVSIQFSE
jgi:hypothetical protein